MKLEADEQIERNVVRVQMAASECGFDVNPVLTDTQGQPMNIPKNFLQVWATDEGTIAITDGKMQAELRPAHAAWLTRHAKSMEDFWWSLTDMEYPAANFSGIW